MVGLLWSRNVWRNAHSTSSKDGNHPHAMAQRNYYLPCGGVSTVTTAWCNAHGCRAGPEGCLEGRESSRTEGQRAKIEVVRPPRGVNSPRTKHHSGWTAATMSRSMRLTAFS